MMCFCHQRIPPGWRSYTVLMESHRKQRSSFSDEPPLKNATITNSFVIPLCSVTHAKFEKLLLNFLHEANHSMWLRHHLSKPSSKHFHILHSIDKENRMCSLPEGAKNMKSVNRWALWATLCRNHNIPVCQMTSLLSWHLPLSRLQLSQEALCCIGL